MSNQSIYMGLPIDRGLNAFHWTAPAEGRPEAVLRHKTGPKSTAELLAFKTVGALSFSQQKQADADKTSRVKRASI